ncbi:serine/threonine-protein kinase [Streptomyces sp. VRA16 Mangrove soil]|uniref:serine/threonine-protein kinase n=1 Tax=Streptomyces sp. VRA16 Mangrove soil TaxID=2817434 RepID=UPI001A9D7066|nr:serine/threonine-protein kinase [Streptomyces sp. VRA16 Mangrove soil]MBO1335104.1 serine/threonine protein kinase [Streptomyces sp. VRA16 Mangrove soil]
MSDNGGAPHGPEQGARRPTSFELRPPQPVHVPHEGNPYVRPATEPTQAVPPQQPAAPDPGAGRLVAGRYRLLSKLGHGGMGTVWRAKDETVDREVAVKEPRVPDHLPERERATVFERMRREARAAARLDHPAVVNVHDVAVEDGQPWIVMEFVQGRSLGDALEEGTLGARDAARVGLQVLGALEAAHAAGILHRDVKPDNVMLGRHDRVVLTDFGIAQIEGETKLTDTGGFIGSPEFIAPERVLGQRPGPASDLWSLGVVLYAATEGVSPFRRSNTPATLQSVLNATPAAPASVHGPLADAISGLLQKDPARRPTAAQVRALLERAAEPPVQPPTQVVRIGPAQGGLRLGRKALLGTGAGVVVAAVIAYLVIANPFAGPLPDGWKKNPVNNLGMTVAAPAGYEKSVPADTDTDKNWVSYTDPSGAVSITAYRYRAADDSGAGIASSSEAQAFGDLDKMKNTEDSDFTSMENPKADQPVARTFHGKKAAVTTIAYDDTSDSTDDPDPRESQILYYRSGKGDLYELWVTYPGKGDFTARGRDVAKAAIDNLDVKNL